MTNGHPFLLSRPPNDNGPCGQSTRDTVLLLVPSNFKDGPVDVSWGIVTMQWRYQRCVRYKLPSTEKWPPVRHNFKSASVACVRHKEVHVSHQHVDSGSGPPPLPHPSRHIRAATLSAAKPRRHTIRCAMVAKRVKKTATSTRAIGEGRWRRRRRRRSTRNKCESIRVRKLETRERSALRSQKDSFMVCHT